MRAEAITPDLALRLSKAFDSPRSKQTDPDSVPQEKRVRIKMRGKNVKTARFSDGGTGASSSYRYRNAVLTERKGFLCCAPRINIIIRYSGAYLGENRLNDEDRVSVLGAC